MPDPRRCLTNRRCSKTPLFFFDLLNQYYHVLQTVFNYISWPQILEDAGAAKPHQQKTSETWTRPVKTWVGKHTDVPQPESTFKNLTTRHTVFRKPILQDHNIHVHL